MPEKRTKKTMQHSTEGSLKFHVHLPGMSQSVKRKPHVTNGIAPLVSMSKVCPHMKPLCRGHWTFIVQVNLDVSRAHKRSHVQLKCQRVTSTVHPPTQAPAPFHTNTVVVHGVQLHTHSSAPPCIPLSTKKLHAVSFPSRIFSRSYSYRRVSAFRFNSNKSYSLRPHLSNALLLVPFLSLMQHLYHTTRSLHEALRSLSSLNVAISFFECRH